MDVLGLISEDIYFSCSSGIIRGDLKTGFDIARRLFDDGYDPVEFLNGLIEHFRNLLLVKISGNAGAVETSENFRKQYVATAGKFSEMDILRIINTISEAEFPLKKSTQPLLRLELLMAKLIAMEQSVTVDQILDVIGQMGGAPGTPPAAVPQSVQPPAKKSSAPAETAPEQAPDGEHHRCVSRTELDAAASPPPDAISLEVFENQWDDFVESFRKENGLTGTIIGYGKPAAYRDGTLEIAFHPDNSFYIDTIRRSREKVNRALKRFYGAPVSFSCIRAQLSPEEKEKYLKKMTLESTEDVIKKIIEREPVIRNIIDTFGGSSIRIRSNQ